MILQRNNFFIALIVALLAMLGEQATARPADGSDSAAVRADSSHLKFISDGVASWYGRRFQGRRTACGERYNRHAMTCAHPSLPFGTKVKVTNVETGEQIVVRVNDRGPFVHNRIIDLSLAAAKAIGIVGCAQVHIETVSDVDVSEPLIAQASPKVRVQHHTKKIPEPDTLPSLAQAEEFAAADSVAQFVQPISFVAAHYHTAAEPMLASRAAWHHVCNAGMRIVDTNDVPVDEHGYTVVVVVTNRYADAKEVRAELLARGYHDVHLLIASTCGENHYKVCVGFEPLPIACRMTAEHLIRDYPMTTITYIHGADDDQNQTAALTY